jgi:glycosyltransferase involved in cell wall biosynthesis
MRNLTAIILTKNEEVNISNAILSLKNIASRIIVLDSFSDDNTVSIASSLGVEVFFNKFINYGEQFQWALDNCNIQTKWVFRFDADEILSSEGENEIISLLHKHENTDVNGIVFNLEITFLGKKLRYGGVYPFSKLCIFKFGFRSKYVNLCFENELKAFPVSLLMH